MKYVMSERIPGEDRTAWSKARSDAEDIAVHAGFERVIVEGLGDRKDAGALEKAKGHAIMARRWKQAFASVPDGAKVLLQLPTVNNTLVIAALIKELTRRHCEVIGLIHDLESLRMVNDTDLPRSQRIRMQVEEFGALKACSRLIVHNPAMAELLREQGIATPVTVLGVFDYLMAEREDGRSWAQANGGNRSALVFAGNLSAEKSGFLYAMPQQIDMELYGGRYVENDLPNLHHHGSFPAPELPQHLAGGWGLVWDGPSVTTCTGPYGAYLRYNNPHKLSLFLAAGFPLVVWDEMALAPFVREHEVGIAVSSLADVPAVLAAVSASEYERMLDNAARVGATLRHGEWLRAALDGYTFAPRGE